MLHRRDMAGSPRVRATFVALAVAALVAVGAWTLSAAASSPPTLPAVQPQELVASVLRAMRTEPGVSGHVETHADFGITALASGPLAGQADQAAPGGLGALASLLGDHHVRVWSSSDGLRISDQLPDGERSIFLDRSNGQAWAWDWKSFTAVRLASVGPATAGASPSPMDLMDPQMAAGRALDALTPSTSVSMGAPERVAGRVAYVLVLRPRTTETLVGQVEVAIDAARRIPLSVAVTARGASVPALSATFTSVRFGPIDPSVYAFSPPKGAHVEQGGDAPMFGDAAEGEGAAGIEGGSDGRIGEYARTFGHGWTTVVALRMPASAANDAAGDVALSGSLLSVRLVERAGHTWLVYGAVPQRTLAAVEDRLP